jgi:3-phosphoshikimate 1-carboxyvinyltransferase
MSQVTIGPGGALRGEVTVPSDKSIAHRALLLGAVADGLTRVQRCALGADNRSTLDLVRRLGVVVRQVDDEVRIAGGGWDGLRPPTEPLDCGNSGTTMRLGAGLLAGRPFAATLIGDDSLSRRPMGRVIEPLRMMGADIRGATGERPPLHVHGGPLRGITYRLPVASAQVKSAILIAGLQAEGPTTVIEPQPTRDHTERLLRQFGASVRIDAESSGGTGSGKRITVQGQQRLQGTLVVLPGDFSSAAFLLVAALLVEGSDLVVRDVGLNPTRTALLDVLRQMGADLEIGEVGRSDEPEPRGWIRARHSALRGVEVDPALIPRLIDEVPLLCVAAACAEGMTRVTGARELRVKESDRIAVMAVQLRSRGVGVVELPDGLEIRGNGGGTAPGRLPLRGGGAESKGDHRIAMAFAVAGLVAEGGISIDGAEAVEVSFPGFWDHLRRWPRGR